MKKVEKKLESLEKQINTKTEQLNNMQTNTYRRQSFASNKIKDIDKLKEIKAVLENNKDSEYINILLDNNIYEHIKYNREYPKLTNNNGGWYDEIRTKFVKLFEKYNITEEIYKELKKIINTDYSYLNKEEKKKQEIKMKKDKLLLSKIEGYYPTPKLVLELIEKKLRENCSDNFISNAVMLEPSAGSGNIVEYFLNKVKSIDCIEYNYNLRELLKEQNFNVVAEDIYKSDDKKYDLIIMNPPFENKQDIRQVKYCFENKLNENGYLIAITSSSAIELESNKEFENFIYENLIFEPFILKNAFKESNTGVSVSIFGLKK
jgi:hypothetical protein